MMIRMVSVCLALIFVLTFSFSFAFAAGGAEDGDPPDVDTRRESRILQHLHG